MMTDPDMEEATGPVAPQPPLVSNYGLVLTVYILYLVGVSYGDNGPCGPNNRLSAKRQNGPSLSIAFPISDYDVLDWTSVFFRWLYNHTHWNRRANFALVGYLDSD
jgi:hypothetical protein